MVGDIIVPCSQCSSKKSSNSSMIVVMVMTILRNDVGFLDEKEKINIRNGERFVVKKLFQPHHSWL